MTAFTLPRIIRACVFDLDGTLVDTLDDFQAALAVMLRGLGRESLSREAVARMVGKGGEYLLRSALLHPASPAGADPDAITPGLYQRAHELYQDAYRQVNGLHSEVFPGVVEALTQLRGQGLPLACLTNKPVRDARILLDAKGLGAFFDRIFGGDSFGSKKPDPRPLIETCRALGIPPGSTLMVGDSVNDAGAARGAGCAVALVSYGYNHGRPIREIDADLYIDRLLELLAHCRFASA